MDLIRFDTMMSRRGPRVCIRACVKGFAQPLAPARGAQQKPPQKPARGGRGFQHPNMGKILPQVLKLPLKPCMKCQEYANRSTQPHLLIWDYKRKSEFPCPLQPAVETCNQLFQQPTAQPTTYRCTTLQGEECGLGDATLINPRRNLQPTKPTTNC